MRRLKVAFLHPDLGIGGAERLVLDVAASLTAQQHTVLFLTNHFDRNHAFDELKDNGDKYPVYVYGDWIPRSIFGRFQALLAYIRMVYLTVVFLLFHRHQHRPDVYFVDLIPIAVPILKWAQQQVIYYCHHPDLLASAPGGVLKKIYRKPIDLVELKSTARADVLLVNSAYTSSIFRETFPEITQPIRVLYPTIAASYLEALQRAQQETPKKISTLIPEISAESKPLVFLSVNRFHPAKKLELAIKALAILKDNTSADIWRNIYVIIAGGYDPQSTTNASYYNELKELTIQHRLDEKVIFLKSPSEGLKTELLLTCDCLLYTPVKEHFGIVPLEAMAAGRPVIACNSGGPRETVNHGITGYLCDANAQSMAQFMRYIIEGGDGVRSKMGARGLIRLNENFSNESFSIALNKILEQFD